MSPAFGEPRRLPAIPDAVPGYEIRPAAPGDEAALLAFHEPTFGAPASTGSRPAVRWHWQYRGHPEGQAMTLARRLSDGAVHALVAATPHRVWVEGEEARFGLFTDCGQHPDAPAPGGVPLFLAAAAAFARDHAGRGKLAVLHGRPSPAVRDLGRFPEVPGHALDWEALRSASVLVLEGRRFARTLDALPPLAVVTEPSPGPEAAALFDRLKPEFGAATVRDEAWFRWRYETHPLHRHVLPRVRDGNGGLRALAAARTSDWPLPRTLLVLDWLCPAGDPEAGLGLLRRLVETAEARSCTSIAVCLPEWTGWFERFQDIGFTVRPTGLCPVVRSFHRPWSEDFLRRRWYTTLGDLDL